MIRPQDRPGPPAQVRADRLGSSYARRALGRLLSPIEARIPCRPREALGGPSLALIRSHPRRFGWKPPPWRERAGRRRHRRPQRGLRFPRPEGRRPGDASDALPRSLPGLHRRPVPVPVLLSRPAVRDAGHQPDVAHVRGRDRLPHEPIRLGGAPERDQPGHEQRARRTRVDAQRARHQPRVHVDVLFQAYFQAFLGIGAHELPRTAARGRIEPVQLSWSYSRRTQMLRKRTGLPWSCRPIGPLAGCGA